MSSKVDSTYKSEEKGILDNKMVFLYNHENIWEWREEEKQMVWNFVGQIVFRWINWPRDLDLLG